MGCGVPYCRVINCCNTLEQPPPTLQHLGKVKELVDFKGVLDILPQRTWQSVAVGPQL